MKTTAWTTARAAALLAVVAVALVAVSGAGAGTRDARYGPLDGWTIRLFEQQEQAYGPLDGWTIRLFKRQQQEPASRHVDARDPLSQEARYGPLDGWAIRALAQSHDQTMPVDSRDYVSASAAPQTSTAGAAATSATSASSGFDFGDAAIGGAATLAVLLLIGVSMVAVRRHGAGELVRS
jgi:hypothetical protein